jgi:hypothetical protein
MSERLIILLIYQSHDISNYIFALWITIVYYQFAISYRTYLFFQAEPDIRSMDTPRKSYTSHKNYYNCYNRYYYQTRCMYSHETSPLGCDAVRSFKQPREGVNQHCDLRHKLLEKHHKKIPCCWENQPGDGHKPRRSSQRWNSCGQPTKANTAKAQHATSTHQKETKEQQDLPIKVLKNILQKRFQSEEAAPYRYKNKTLNPNPNTASASTMASGFSRGTPTDLRNPDPFQESSP